VTSTSQIMRVHIVDRAGNGAGTQVLGKNSGADRVARHMTSTIPDVQRAWDTWHESREQELRTPHGWLSLTALHWLTETPTGYPGLPGLWSADADGVTLTAAAADGIVIGTTREPRHIDGTVHLHPVDGLPGTMVEIGGRSVDQVRVEVARRGELHVLRVRDPQAPTRLGFTGVPAFPVDARWVVQGRFEAYPQPRTLTVGAVVDGLTHHPVAPGVVRFELDGRAHELVALASRKGGLTLHFRDATSGVTTYPGGRSVAVDEPGADGVVTIDLNRLTNLPCAFTAYATCPLPPRENVLDVAVEAGEQLPVTV
jgi:uncharacterized protein